MNKVRIMITVPRKWELPSDFHNVKVGIKRFKVPMQEVTSSNSNPYPDNFYIGKAIADGSCFFDSFRQGLKQ
ncbi:hypothetical protein [Wolbachia pipientis]|uniref:hypothetical protein n=1 Tax=Wolbachia pipientis TaxID=955 RepID=UPI0025A344DC|nr:hypothetical protein [Wolbachia pipientis]MDM8334965.1 hypothetical protein [Wolbachia pipientis]